jgi:hypothetical protein
MVEPIFLEARAGFEPDPELEEFLKGASLSGDANRRKLNFWGV